MRLSGRIAVVTGASRGLGRAIAASLAREGTKVACLARDGLALDALTRGIIADGGEAIAVVTDVSQRESVLAAAERVRQAFGPPDIVINNAGTGWYKPFEAWSWEEIDETIDVNLKGPVYVTKAFFESLVTTRGTIINIASDLARRYLPNMAVYVGTKHAVLGFSGSLLRELKGREVKVMTLLPGIIDTAFGGGEEGSRDVRWSLKPEELGEYVVTLLTLPQHWVADEVMVHPMHQDF